MTALQVSREHEREQERKRRKTWKTLRRKLKTGHTDLASGRTKTLARLFSLKLQ